MENQRSAPADTYPTRRSLREAQERTKRRTSGRKRRGINTAQQVPLAERTTTELPTVPAVPLAQRVLTQSQSMAPATPRRARPRPSRIAALPRVALLACLAAATTFVPLQGVPASLASAQQAVQYSASDMLDTLMGAGEDSAPEAEIAALAADPHVGVRAAMSASRNQDRGLPSCSLQAQGANGAAAAETALPLPNLVMPLAEGSYSTSSSYGYRSILGRTGLHTGTDYAAPAGTPIHSIADGVVEYTGPGKNGRSSMIIIIRHNVNGQIVRSWYVHMYSNGVYTTPGQQVKAGEVIAAVGSNGFSTGPHLHLEIHLDNNLTTTNPAAWLASNGAAALDQEIRDCLAQ